MTQIGRLITAMVTPFDTSLNVDYSQARHLAKALIESGSDGLVVTGTTGENPALAHDENVRLWNEVKETVGEEGTVIAGSGTNGTGETIKLAQMAEKAGVDAQLLVVPYYNKPTQEGLYQHFKAIAESTSLPCILYNVPSRTIVNMDADTTLRLAHDVPNIVGTKEASGDLAQIGMIIRDAPVGFKVWSGNDSDTFAVVSLGGWGVISVASHLIGLQIKRMLEFASAGDTESASVQHKAQLPLATGLFTITSPIPIKYCLNKAGFHVGGLRLPLVAADPSTAAFLDNLLSNYEIDLPITTPV